MRAVAFRRLVAVALVACAIPAARAQTFPARTVTIIVPFSPGGGADTLARMLAGPLAARWKQSVIVENRPGASGHIGASQVARSVADGHTLLMSSTASLDEKNEKDFAPVALVSAAPYVVVVRKGLGVASIADLVRSTKAEPGKLTFGSSGPGSASHLSGELFDQVAGVSMIHVPYKGTAPAVTDLLGGTIDVMFAPMQSVSAYMKSGQLVPLAVTSTARAKAAPQLPTVAEAGVAGYSSTGWFGLLAPAATPKATVDRIAADVNAELARPEMQAAMLAAGAEAAQGTPASFQSFIRSELAKWGPLEKRLGIQRE